MNNRGANQKPELILKRANDIVNLGTGTGEKEKRIALDLLHNAISIKKKSAWTKNYESLMRRHVELSVDIKDHATAKDGMHQYRNLCINAEPASLEGIILYLIELGERKLGDAKRRSNQASIAATAQLADLEQDESPESIVLSAMTEDGATDRTYREMVVPWLKFVWESYRAAVELLSRIPKLDKTYHDISRRAFQFCHDNKRRTEFRRLCEMLRSQLENLQKPLPSNILKAAKPQWEWTPDVVEMYMQTKFEQLDKATAMDLWNEAFRTIEDISKILAKKAAKTKSLATYYEKLTKIFWVADNKLFHAYALLKLYSLSILKGEDKQALASAVLLAAMSVPATATVAAATAASALGLTDERDAEDYQVDRNAELAALLDFHSVNPTRQSLMQEITQRQVASVAHAEFAELFVSMEVEFSPIKLAKKIAPAVSLLRTLSTTTNNNSSSAPALQQYASPLERNIVIRYMQQLSKAYSQVKIAYVLQALSGLVVLSRMQIERVLVDAVRARHLSLKVSHVDGSITFVNNIAALQAVDAQVYQLGHVLAQAHDTVRSVVLTASQQQTASTVEAVKAQQIAQRQAYFKEVELAYDDLYFDLLERARVIENRKEDYELQMIKKDEIAKTKEEEDARRKIREQELLVEKIRREEEEARRRKEQEEQDIIRVYAELKRLGFPKDMSEVTAMTAEQRKQALKDAEDAYRKVKEEEKKRLEAQAKSFDYRVRAERLESFAKVDARKGTFAGEDEVLCTVTTEAMHQRWTEEHAKQLEEKARLSKMQSYRAGFEATFRAQQLAVYEEFRAFEISRQLKRLRDIQLVAARKLAAEEKEKNAEEMRRRAIEEEERRLEVMRASVLRAERQREEQLQREAEEKAEKQRQAQLEAAANAAANAAAATPPPAPAPAAASTAGKYVARGGSDRDRERERGSGGFGSSRGFGSEQRGGARDEGEGGAWRSSRAGERGGFGDRERSERGFGGGGFGDRGGERGGERGGFGGERGGDRERERGGERGGFGGDRDRDRGGDRDRERPAPRGNDRDRPTNSRAEGGWR